VFNWSWKCLVGQCWLNKPTPSGGETSEAYGFTGPTILDTGMSANNCGAAASINQAYNNYSNNTFTYAIFAGGYDSNSFAYTLLVGALGASAGEQAYITAIYTYGIDLPGWGNLIP